MIRLLLDENISPTLVSRLADLDVYAQSVPHIGLSGRMDHEIWKYALDHNFAVVTTNARDFRALLDVEAHPGLIVLRERGLTRDEQWDADVRNLTYFKTSILFQQSQTSY